MLSPFRSCACSSKHLAWKTLFAFAWLSMLATSPTRAQMLTAENSVAKNTLDSQLVLALPAALQTGMSAGVGAGFSRRATAGGLLSWGARASWSTATEYTLIDTVRNDDIRLRLCGSIQHVAGRGSFGLRLGAGATVVYESRTRAQGNRAGLTGSDLETTDWSLLPAADLEAVVVLRVWNSWGLSLNGGPSLHVIGGSARMGWTSGAGVSWQP